MPSNEDKQLQPLSGCKLLHWDQLRERLASMKAFSRRKAYCEASCGLNRRPITPALRPFARTKEKFVVGSHFKPANFTRRLSGKTTTGRRQKQGLKSAKRACPHTEATDLFIFRDNDADRAVAIRDVQVNDGSLWKGATLSEVDLSSPEFGPPVT